MPAPNAPAKSGSGNAPSPRQEPAGGPLPGYFHAMVAVFWLGVLMAIPAVRRLALGNLSWTLALAAVAATVGMYAWARHTPSSVMPGGMTFLLVGLLGLSLFPLTAARPVYQIMVLRGIFLFVMVVTPGALYVLFLWTRRRGIFNEYLVNLDRLGLLERRDLTPLSDNGAADVEEESTWRLRVGGYLQKFQAAFGPLGPQLETQLLSAADLRATLVQPHWAEEAAASASGTPSKGAVAPLVLSTILCALGWFLALPPWVYPEPKDIGEVCSLAMSPVQQPAVFAFLGAYFFSVTMLFRRFVRRDLRTSAYMAFVLRVATSVIFVWVAQRLLPGAVLGGLASDRAMCVIGFIIGVFPPVIWQLLRSFLKAMRMQLPAFETNLPINDLDGVNVWHRARLEDEDIESIPSMATADLVDLLLQTKFPPDRIIDWMDQAILYTCLGPEAAGASRRHLLRQHGIRTATQLVYEYRRSVKRQDVASLEAILPHDGRSQLRSIVDALLTNPNLDLIRRWRGLPADEFAGWQLPGVQGGPAAIAARAVRV